MTTIKKEAIILVHGIWMKGFEFAYLSFKFKQQGYRVYHFRYASVTKTPEENAKCLYQFLSRVKELTIHFVAHSMGGIVLQHLFHHYEIKQDGKIVMIATPVNGSEVARYLNQKKFRKKLLGKAIEKGLLGDAPGWQTERKICMVAGTMSLGLGVLLAPKALHKPNDGTVNLDETKFEQVTESHEITLSHFSLLFSVKVLKIIVRFLSTKS